MAFEELIAEIEAQERWLQGLGAEVPIPDGLLERAKQRTRVAVDEAWLAEHDATEPPPRVLAAVKRAVADELARGPVRPVRASWDRPDLRRAFGRYRSLAAAAAVVFAAGLGFWASVSPPDEVADTGSLTDLVAVLTTQADQEEAEWCTIEAELALLEEAFAQGTTSDWDRHRLDDFDDEADELLQDVDEWLGDGADAS